MQLADLDRVGTFLMGSPEGLEDEDERPQRRVTLSQPFRVMCVPVTNAQYRAFDPAFVAQTWPGVSEDELAYHPAVGVSWYAAVSFCRWLGARASWAAGARLPTDAEWEYVCRAGTASTYWSGDGEEALNQVGWVDTNSQGRPHRVGELAPNPWGLYDVHGNVWEWTSDAPRLFWAAPAGLSGGRWCSARGGSWLTPPTSARSAARSLAHGADPPSSIGFRVVLPGPGPRP